MDHFKLLPKSFYLCLVSPVFVPMVLTRAAFGYIIGGFFVFMPKYIENQFHVSASVAALGGGAVMSACAAIGLKFSN